MRGVQLGVVITSPTPVEEVGPPAIVSGRELAGAVLALVPLVLILLGHVALDRGWLDWGPLVPIVVRAFSAATMLAIGLVSLARFIGRRRASALIVGVAFTGAGVLLAVRLTLHVVASVTGIQELFETGGRLGWAQHMFLPLVLLAGVLLVPERSERTNSKGHRTFAVVAVVLLLAGLVGPWNPSFPGGVVAGSLVARPDAAWIVATYLVLLAILWRRPDVGATTEGRWLTFALYVGFLNQTLVAPFWHTAAGAAATLDAVTHLMLVLIAGTGVLLGMVRLARSEDAALTSLRSQGRERERVEQALAKQAARLQQANEELSQYAYLASHDLQEPLRMVTNYLQLIERRYDDVLDDDGREFMRFAVDGAVRMKRLTNDLLRYSRVSTQPFEPAPTDAGAALAAACQNLETAIAEAGAAVTSDPLPAVSMDTVQLVQLFQNLVGNALKFWREGTPPRIHVSGAREGDFWRFSLSDNGIGIEAKYHDRVFAVFQRLHGGDAYPGSGVGLALCRKIVERHGGAIWFRGTPGEGTTFHWTVPVDPEAVRGAAEAESDDPELEGHVTTLIDRARELI